MQWHGERCRLGGLSFLNLGVFGMLRLHCFLNTILILTRVCCGKVFRQIWKRGSQKFKPYGPAIETNVIIIFLICIASLQPEKCLWTFSSCKHITCFLTNMYVAILNKDNMRLIWLQKHSYQCTDWTIFFKWWDFWWEVISSCWGNNNTRFFS